MALDFTWDNVGSKIIATLNDTAYLPDPWEDATGKEREEWWHSDVPKQTAQYPRGVVFFDTDSDEDKSFGENFYLTQNETFTIYFYTKENFVYEDENGNEYKNQDLVRYFLRRVFNVIKRTQKIKGYHISGKDSIDIVPPAIGENVHLWIGVLPITFTKRER